MAGNGWLNHATTYPRYGMISKVSKLVGSTYRLIGLEALGLVLGTT